MSKYLCTFSGKYGDILWSLPTAKYLAERVAGGKVDFAVMPYYRNLLPLLASQSYIDKAFVIESWLRTHSNHGDQPWEPPMDWGPGSQYCCPYGAGDPDWYTRIWHLTYKGHPGISAPSMPLVDFIAYQQGLNFNNFQVTPFLDVDESVQEEAAKIHFSSGQMLDVIKENRLVTYSFNEQYDEIKKAFLNALWWRANSERFEFFDVATVGWKEAAWLIKKSLAYVGCRSACWVLANGVGKTVISFEPHPSRHANCHLGKVFGNPYANEVPLPFGLPPTVAADTTTSLLIKMREEACAVSSQT